MSEENCARFFVSRQPIIAGERRLIGWELAFGAPSGEALDPQDASADRYLATLEGFARSARWDSLLAGGRALIHANRRLIFSDVLEQMPRNRLLLGLAPCDEIDASLSNRLHDLHGRRGTRLLFLDYRRRDPREQLLDLADAVEIDAFGLDEATCSLLVRRAQRRKLQVLASSVRHEQDFVRIRDAGFELFSGGSYAEPSGDEATRATAEGKVLLQLLVEARGEIEIDSVARQVEANPALAEGLLKLVNSLELARASKIEDVGQALIMIGAKGLSRWLNLLLFQIGHRNGLRSPLFRVAASRARLMELILGGGVAGAPPAVKDRADTAFLVGILSLVHVLLGVDRETAIGDLSLPEEMRVALTEHAGELGRLLRLAECLDCGEFPEVAEIATELGVAPEMLWEHQCAAWDWVTLML